MILIPDVHGRTFWKRAVEMAGDSETIVFLGDYLDPYCREIDAVSGKKIDPQSALSNFRQILEFKKAHPKKVVLLLGNHDTEYFLHTSAAREDRYNFEAIGRLFLDNCHLFEYGYHTTINGQKYCFSHSCITEGWAKQASFVLGPCHSPEEVVDTMDTLTDAERREVLNQIGYERCGLHKFGSMIWADVEEVAHLGWDGCSTFQVFGHSQQIQDPVKGNRFAMLDVRRPFRLDETSTAPRIQDRIVEMEI